MANTPNYNLKKVEYTEIADIPGHFNANFDTIDTEMKNNADAATAAEVNAKSYASGLIGALSNLLTTAKNNIVAAVNEIFGKVEDVEDDLLAHKADDVTQGEIPHIGLGGSISHATNTGEVTTPHLRQVNASIRGTASGNMSQVNASQDSTASGALSQVNASRDSTASGEYSQVNASQNSTVSGNISQVNASRNSVASGNCSLISASRDCENGGRGSAIIACGAYDIDGRGAKIVDRVNAVIIASRGVELPDSFSLAGGMTQGAPSTANRKWQIYSQSGDIQIAGQLTPGHSFTDFAELFPNLTGQKQGYGLLQTIDGFGVRPAQEGERVIGVTTATAAIVLGDTPFSWQGRWLKDEWGAYIYETIIDEETGEEITYPKENPEWNPELEQQSRLQRPDEWTVVGLLGQVYVRLKEDVQPMDYVKAWQNGIGQKSLEPTNLQVMKITQEYDAEKGYKIGFCLLR